MRRPSVTPLRRPGRDSCNACRPLGDSKPLQGEPASGRPTQRDGQAGAHQEARKNPSSGDSWIDRSPRPTDATDRRDGGAELSPVRLRELRSASLPPLPPNVDQTRTPEADSAHQFQKKRTSNSGKESRRGSEATPACPAGEPRFLLGDASGPNDPPAPL